MKKFGVIHVTVSPLVLLLTASTAWSQAQPVMNPYGAGYNTGAPTNYPPAEASLQQSAATNNQAANNQAALDQAAMNQQQGDGTSTSKGLSANDLNSLKAAYDGLKEKWDAARAKRAEKDAPPVTTDETTDLTEKDPNATTKKAVVNKKAPANSTAALTETAPVPESAYDRHGKQALLQKNAQIEATKAPEVGLDKNPGGQATVELQMGGGQSYGFSNPSGPGYTPPKSEQVKTYTIEDPKNLEPVKISNPATHSDNGFSYKSGENTVTGVQTEASGIVTQDVKVRDKNDKVIQSSIKSTSKDANGRVASDYTNVEGNKTETGNSLTDKDGKVLLDNHSTKVVGGPNGKTQSYSAESVASTQDGMTVKKSQDFNQSYVGKSGTSFDRRTNVVSTTVDGKQVNQIDNSTSLVNVKAKMNGGTKAQQIAGTEKTVVNGDGSMSVKKSTELQNVKMRAGNRNKIAEGDSATGENEIRNGKIKTLSWDTDSNKTESKYRAKGTVKREVEVGDDGVEVTKFRMDSISKDKKVTIDDDGKRVVTKHKLAKDGTVMERTNDGKGWQKVEVNDQNKDKYAAYAKAGEEKNADYQKKLVAASNRKIANGKGLESAGTKNSEKVQRKIANSSPLIDPSKDLRTDAQKTAATNKETKQKLDAAAKKTKQEQAANDKEKKKKQAIDDRLKKQQAAADKKKNQAAAQAKLEKQKQAAALKKQRVEKEKADKLKRQAKVAQDKKDREIKAAAAKKLREQKAAAAKLAREQAAARRRSTASSR